MTRLEKGGTYFSVSKVSTGLQKQQITQPCGQRCCARRRVPAVRRLHAAVVLIVLYSSPTARRSRPGSVPGSLTLDNYVRVLTQPAGAAALHDQHRLQRPGRRDRRRRPAVRCTPPAEVPQLGPRRSSSTSSTSRGSSPQPSSPWASSSLDHPNPLVGGAVLTGTTVILLIAFVTIKIPFTLRMLKASFAAVNSSLEEAADIMGAKTLYVFRRILLPIVLPPPPPSRHSTSTHPGRLRHRHPPRPPPVPAPGPVSSRPTPTAPGASTASPTPSSTQCADGHHRGDDVLVYGRSTSGKGRRRRRPRALPPPADSGASAAVAGSPAAQPVAGTRARTGAS